MNLITFWNLSHRNMAYKMDLICKCIQGACTGILCTDLGGLLGGAVLYLAKVSVSRHCFTVVWCLIGNGCQAETILSFLLTCLCFQS